MTFEERQRQTMADFTRSSWSTLPPVLSRESRRLDEIAAMIERDRQQRRAIEAMEADEARNANYRDMARKA
jgi:hypothetical protein